MSFKNDCINELTRKLLYKIKNYGNLKLHGFEIELLISLFDTYRIHGLTRCNKTGEYKATNREDFICSLNIDNGVINKKGDFVVVVKTSPSIWDN